MSVLILGATGGIGSALAQQLAARGVPLMLAARNEAKLAALAEKTGGATHVLDARDPTQVRVAAKAAKKRFGTVVGIANCVGSLLLKPAHTTTIEELEETVAVNLWSAFGAVQAAADVMRKQGGSVALIASAASRTGLANHEAIAAAKGAVTGLGLSAAATYASWGIRVNVVAPGLVETPMTEKLTSGPARKVSDAMHPLGRIGTPEDVARALDWLLDPNQAWITGQVLGVDGGLATLRPKQ
ncbi:MAG: SDR family NAD(P)-dependent oxidoreductase [Planctomycetota bacterium]|nr:SDR family NAD(P)-dependent oxidoreductase [Planctomycetota bacterium]